MKKILIALVMLALVFGSVFAADPTLVIEATSSALTVEREGSGDTTLTSLQQTWNGPYNSNNILSNGVGYYGTMIWFQVTDADYGAVVNIPVYFQSDYTVTFENLIQSWAFSAWANVGDHLKLYGGKLLGGLKIVPVYTGGGTAFFDYTLSGISIWQITDGPYYAFGSSDRLDVSDKGVDQLDGPLIVEYHNRKDDSPYYFQLAWMNDQVATSSTVGNTEILTKFGARFFTRNLTDKFDFTATWIMADVNSTAWVDKYEHTIGAWATFNGLTEGLNFSVGYSALFPVFTDSSSHPKEYTNGFDLFGSIKLSDAFTLNTQNNVSIKWSNNYTAPTSRTNDTDFVLYNLFTTSIALDEKLSLRPVLKNTLIVQTFGKVFNGDKYADDVWTTDKLTLAADLRYSISPYAYTWFGISLTETFSQYQKHDPVKPQDKGDVVVNDNVMRFVIPVGISIVF
jgi:hypothetical protein